MSFKEYLVRIKMNHLVVVEKLIGVDTLFQMITVKEIGKELKIGIGSMETLIKFNKVNLRRAFSFNA